MEISEKRQFERLEFRESVRLQFKDPLNFQGCLSCNFSQGGVQLNVNEFIGLQEKVMLNIVHGKQGVKEYAGRVVWVEQVPQMDRYRVGIQFIGDEFNFGLSAAS